MKKRFQAVSLDKQVQETVEETKDSIQLLQKDQLLRGLNSKGEKIGRYRSNKYARVKNEMNPLPGLGIPDLKVTGSFHTKISTTVTPDTFKSDSSDSKAPNLKEKYGNDIFGLTDESKSEYIQELKPVFVKKMKENLKV